MGNSPAGDLAHLTLIAGLHRAGQLDFHQIDVGQPAASISKEAGHAR